MTCLFMMDLDSLSFMKEIFIVLMLPPSQLRIKDVGPAWRRIIAEDPRVHQLSLSLVINHFFHLFAFFNFARFLKIKLQI